MKISALQYILSMGGYFAILMLIVEYMRKHYRFANCFWIASLLTFPLWLMGGVVGWFRWAKICSVIFPTIFVGFCRIANYEKKDGKLWGKIQKQWVLWFVYGILFLNIMEATIKDLTTGHIFNGMCGLMLCATIPLATGGKYWKYSKREYGDLLVFTTAAWNFLYTTWNLCFVYGESPNYFASSVCILLAAELYPIIKRRPELYVMSRVYTLAAHMIVRSCMGSTLLVLMDSSSWANANVLKYWGIVNCIIIIPYTVWYFIKLKKGTEEKSFFRGRSGIEVS